MPSSKPKPSEVAAEAKRHYIPLIKANYADTWPTFSYLFPQPLTDIPSTPSAHQFAPAPPTFVVVFADPVDYTIQWEKGTQLRVPFICAANDKRAGGDWDTGVVGYEERFCRRSNLSATLNTPGPDSNVHSNYPIPSEGAIYSEHVVVFRGPHDQYKKLDEWCDLPVVSIPPARWPKLNHNGTKYAFPLERDLVKNKIRSALRICVYAGFRNVVIGDFGLGNSYRNPPEEIAGLWREVFLYDPDIRGQFEYVAFVFEDQSQSTSKLILDDIAKKSKSGGSGSSSKGKSKSSSSSAAGSSSSTGKKGCPTDYHIFYQVFDAQAVQAVLSSPDPRYGLSTIMSP